MATNYCVLSDLGRYYEDFLLDFYGTMMGGTSGTVLASGSTSAQSDVTSIFRAMNERLDAIEKIKTIPVGTQAATGRYPDHLIEWNAKGVIWQKLRARHAHQAEGEYPQWVLDYRTDCEAILTDISRGNIIFRDDTSLGEGGIQPPTIATQSGIATFYTNWDTGDPYEGGDFRRKFVVQIDGTTGGNTIGDATFKWSFDAGASWEETGVDTATIWTELDANCKVRWGPDSGTANQIQYGDRWEWDCVPLETRMYGESAHVKARTFWRR